MVLLLRLSISLSLLLAGCTPSARPAQSGMSPPATTSAAAPAADPTYVLRFERTGCMGKCPSFVLTVEADGTAHYLGRRFAHYEGEKTLQLAPDVLSTVEQLAKQMHFDEMPEDEFGQGMMDAPSALVTLQQEAGYRSVRCTGNECPQPLLDLHRYLDRVLEQAFGTTPPEGE